MIIRESKRGLVIGILAFLILIVVLIVISIKQLEKSNSTVETSANIIEFENEIIEIDTSENKTIEDNVTNLTNENKTIENNVTNLTNENKTIENNVTNNIDKNTVSDNTIEENRITTKESKASTVGKKGTIYLTFDDGPSNNITPKILDILKGENVKATFFILNYDSNGEKIVKRELEEGHAVGIHGYSHKYSEIYQTEDTYMENLNKLQAKIEKSTGISSKITRFPGGSSNTVSEKYNVGIMSRLTELVEENGYKYYDWNIDSNDAGSAKNKTQVYRNVIKGLSKNRPNVVLMHDFSRGAKTLNALKDIIRYAKDNGYEFEKITYDGNLIMHHNVNN